MPIPRGNRREVTVRFSKNFLRFTNRENGVNNTAHKAMMSKIKKDQKRFEALFRRGTEMLHRGQTDRALQLLERAHQLDPEHVDTAVNLSGAYILSKKFVEAVHLLEPFKDREWDHAMIWTNLGAAYLGNPVLAREEEQKKAITAFKRALAIDPAVPNVAYNIGLIYRDRNEIGEAINWFEKAVQTNPNDRDARKLIGRLQENSKQG